MIPKNRFSLAVLAFALILIVVSGGALAKQSVNVGETTVVTPSAGAGTDTGEATTPVEAMPARAWATAGVSEGKITARGPSCEVGDANHASESCEQGSVETSAPTWYAQYGYEVDVPVLDSGADTFSQNGRTTSLSAVVVPAAPTDPIVYYVAAAGGFSLAAVWAATRAARYGLIGLLPLYSHIRDDQILDDPNRAAIFTAIKGEPGVSTKDIADRLGLAWGTVTHHLAKLERRRFVVSKKYGKYRRYFVNGHAQGSPDKDAVAVLKVARTAEVAEFIRGHPGVNQKLVGERLGLSASTVLWHVKRLMSANLVEKVRDGKMVRYFAVIDSMAPAAVIARSPATATASGPTATFYRA